MRDNMSEAVNGRYDGPATVNYRNPLNLLILGGIMLIAAIAIGTSFTIVNFRQRALQKSERELQNTVLLLSRHFDRELENFDAVERDLTRRMQSTGTPEAFKNQMSGEAAHAALQTFVSGTTDVAGINVYDANGQLINSSLFWPLPAINVGDRAYFKELKADPSPAVVVAPVYSRFTGGWTTVVARNVVGPNGQFLGVVSRGLRPANFEKFFESVALGEGAAISMLHRDGTLLARYPHVENMIGQNLNGAPAQKLLQNADHGTLRLHSPVDGEDRLASARVLSQFPLSVLATIKVSSALADWQEQTRFLVGAAALAALAIGLTLFLIVRKLSEQHQNSERRLALEKERLDTAVNNMTQGLLLYDQDGRIVLFNQRYLEMYGLSRDIVKPGLHFRDLIAYRKALGSFKGDVDAFCSRTLSNVAEKKATHTIIETPDGREIEIGNQPLKSGGWVATQEDITERRRAEKKIAHLAHYDALTDLPNRVLFREQLERELERTKRGEQLAMLYIDIDEFKSVNDSLGHPVGDELLKAVASRLRNCVRETDFVARLGGDEFAVVQTGVGQPSDVMELVKRIYETIREPYECLGHHVTTDASIGIAMAPHDGTDLDQLLKSADLAMYGAKSDGRRTYRFFEAEMDARVKARRTLELDMRQAIVDGAFELHYQPVVNLHSNEIVGCEALLRWRHPVRGMISPAEFIPIAEETGLICEIGDWVLATACAEAAGWPSNIRLAVNVSPVQFRSHAFSLKVANTLAATGLSANRLELEITEAVLIRDDETARTLLQHLRSLGVRIALDDFGTGYSSLSYLRRFPFDKIKIDRSFVDGITESDGSSSIVQAVINIANAQNMTTTAEGVETESQREMLRDLGCTEMQGFLFSRPRPVMEIRSLLSPETNCVAAA
ncbi:bifunctional diguanylate cyclase/phosphodiesterase [Bradyrhizobium canariense]|uniref:Diguanylate cyclase/phosphodiesterase n=1 Tax=Bradyrhizobium canariense TaxID=255045 RepID=A0A1H1YHF1_9BRAD|nr:EAL domain-containing protein [Bradyrhizobium canariense]SDT20801.1 diguanylate cyclase/phosphodiesterase [Bradyrhizobium canariense]